MRKHNRNIPAAFLDEDMNDYSEEEMINRQMRAEKLKMMRDGDFDED